MRPIELTLAVLTLLAGLVRLVPDIPTKYKDRLAPFLLIITAAAQILLEGFRWQLWPLILAIVGLITLSLIQLEKKWYWTVWGAALFLGALSITAGSLIPVARPYPITGPYQVGTREFHLADSQRVEIYGEDPTAPRELMAQIWYPASPEKSDRRARWMPGIEYAAPVIAAKLNLPAFSLGHLQYVTANAYWEAPALPAGGTYPVLIFSHGWEGFKEQNIYQVEELASHGYVVVGINHTYGAIHTLFPDGRQFQTNHDALPSGVSDEVYDQASDTLSRQWSEDIDLVLDELAALNQSDGEWFLAGSLDLDKIGVFGHSTGGGAAVRFCLSDVRCQALLGMDVWAEPAQTLIQDLILRKPALLLYSENWIASDEPDRNGDLLGLLVDKAENAVIEITIQGTQHYDFSSLPMLSPLTTTLGLKGPIDGDLVLEIINAESLAFFDRYLVGDSEISLEGVSQRYPEAWYGVRPGKSD